MCLQLQWLLQTMSATKLKIKYMICNRSKLKYVSTCCNYKNSFIFIFTPNEMINIITIKTELLYVCFDYICRKQLDVILSEKRLKNPDRRTVQYKRRYLNKTLCDWRKRTVICEMRFFSKAIFDFFERIIITFLLYIVFAYGTSHM